MPIICRHQVFPGELPPDGSEGSRIADIMAPYKDDDTYFILNEVLGQHDEAEDLNAEELREFLHCVLGSPDDFAADFAAMSDEDKFNNFADLKVSAIVEAYAKSAENDELVLEPNGSPIGLLLAKYHLPITALAKAAERVTVKGKE